MPPLIPVPPDSCSTTWEQYSTQDYEFNLSKDKNYLTYQNRMKQSGLDRKNCHKTWTVLIYMAVTEDLIPFAYANLLEMEAYLPSKKNGSSIRTDVIVQLNVEKNQHFDRFHIFESSQNQTLQLNREKVAQLSKTQIQSPLISQLTKALPVSEQKQLEEFLKWGIQEYPSEHYFVIVWGHGEGWTAIHPLKISPPSTRTGRFGGLAFDGDSEYLDIPGLREVLKNVKEWSGDPLDVFVSDACLMQTVEDATELAQYTLYTYGSEDIQTYWGMDYSSILCQLNSGTFEESAPQRSMELYPGEPYLLAWALPSINEKAYRPGQGALSLADPENSQELTACSISSKHLRTSLVPSLNLLGQSLIAFIEEEKTRWMDLKGLMETGPFYESGTQDLGAFIEGLSHLIQSDIQSHHNRATPMALKLKQSMEKTYHALNYTVVNSALGTKYRRFCPQKEYGPRGISIWLPQFEGEFHERIGDFSKSLFYGADACETPGWACWIKKMYSK